MAINLSDFLADFGTPFCKAIVEQWRKAKRWSWKKTEVAFKHRLQYDIQSLILANKTDPISVNFTPNGNYWKAHIFGEEHEWVVTNKSPTFPPKYNALFIDLDIKETVCENREELLATAIETWWILGMEPTWVLRKEWWPHVYWIIDPEDRMEADKLFSIQEFEDILKYVATRFVGGDESVWRMTGFMRMPNTLHRKKSNLEKVGANPLPVKLYQRYDGKLQEEYNEEKKNYITIDKLIALLELSKGEEHIKKDTRLITMHLNKFITSMVDNISFPEILEALKKYPRRYIAKKSEEKIFNEKKYVFELDWTNINLAFEDWTKIYTDGYKFKEWKDKRDISFINSFTKQWTALMYDNYERPKGNVYSFLKWYFGNNTQKVLEFLKNEFDINISNIDYEELDAKDKTFARGESVLLCKHNEWVSLEERKTLPNWQLVLVMNKIFDTPLMPVWYIETNITDDFMESPDINKVYIFNDLKNNRQVTLKRFNTKATFNKHINRLWLHCYSNEDIVATMFSILDRQKEWTIPLIQHITYNGVYEDFVMLWWKIIHKQPNFDHKKYFFNPIFDFEVASELKQITPKQFICKMQSLFDDKFIFLPILQCSAMMLMNVWKDELKLMIYPSILFTWETGKGKSTIVDIMKSYAGYIGKARELSLSWWSSTAQPVRQKATDNSILFLEEVTWEINPKTEASVRAIINRDIWALWLSWWKNAIYNFRSPVLALWQRTFSEDSINNRFLIIDMDHQKKRGTQKEVNELKTFSCYKYIYEKLYQNWHLIKELYEKYSEKLIESELMHRARDSIIFIFIMNEFLDLNIPFETLLEHVNYHLNNVWLQKPKQEVSPELAFKNVLVSWFLKKAIFGTHTDIDNNKKTRYELYFADSYLEQNRAKIHSSVAFFNEKAREEWRPDVMYMINNMLVITVTEVGAAKVDEVLDIIMKWLVKAAKWVLTYVPSL